MKSRITQLIAKPLAIALASVAGWLGATGEDTADLAIALASAVVAIGAWALDLLIHKAETGGVSKPAGTKRPIARLMLPLGLSLMLLGGCASPTARWVTARESVTTAQDVTVSLHHAEAIDDADLKAVAPWIISARNQVNAAYVYLPDGGPTYDKLLASVAEYIARVRVRLRGANP